MSGRKRKSTRKRTSKRPSRRSSKRGSKRGSKRRSKRASTRKKQPDSKLKKGLKTAGKVSLNVLGTYVGVQAGMLGKQLYDMKKIRRDYSKAVVSEPTDELVREGKIEKFKTINTNLQSAPIAVKNAFLTELVLAHEKGMNVCDFDAWLTIEKQLGEGSFGTARSVCVPKGDCKYSAVSKRTQIEPPARMYVGPNIEKIIRTDHAFKNEVIAFDLIWEHQKKAEKLIQQGKDVPYPLNKMNHFIMMFHFLECRKPKKDITVGIQLMEKFGKGKTLRNATGLGVRKRTTQWWISVLKQLSNISDALDMMKLNHNDFQLENVLVINPDSPYGPDERVSLDKLFLKVIDFGSATVAPDAVSKSKREEMKFQSITAYFRSPPQPTYVPGRDLYLMLQWMMGEIDDNPLSRLVIPSQLQNTVKDSIESIAKNANENDSKKTAGDILRTELKIAFPAYTSFINS